MGWADAAQDFQLYIKFTGLNELVRQKGAIDGLGQEEWQYWGKLSRKSPGSALLRHS